MQIQLLYVKRFHILNFNQPFSPLILTQLFIQILAFTATDILSAAPSVVPGCQAGRHTNPLTLDTTFTLARKLNYFLWLVFSHIICLRSYPPHQQPSQHSIAKPACLWPVISVFPIIKTIC